MRLRVRFILVALLGVVAAPAQNGGPAPNIVLITVDTLRADHVSSYGYHFRTTPNIDQLAADGARFDRAYSAVPLTGPSHITMLSARYPQEHGARINGLAYSDDRKLLFLPQILRANGYRTGAFVSAPPLYSRLTRLDRHFDLYDEELDSPYQVVNSRRFAEDVTPRAIGWMRQRGNQPFFLWVHLFDPHAPYQQRKEFENLPRIGPPRYPGLNTRDGAAMRRVREYDAEVAYADHHIGKLLAAIDEMGLRDQTLVVLTSDHGESLGEHGYIGHARHLYENIVRVPLVVRYPAVVAPGTLITERVSLIDLTPTVVDLAMRRRRSGAELPIDLGGRTLSAALTGGKIDDGVVRYLTFGGKKGFFPRWMSFLWTDIDSRPLMIGSAAGNRKVVWEVQDERVQIFDLVRDPHELSPGKPGRESPQYELESARLGRWYEGTRSEAGENHMTDEDLETLRSLGYLQ